MNKIQKIKDWTSKTQDGLMDIQGNFGYPEHEGAHHILCNLDAYIDSLEKEPVNNDLEEAAVEAFKHIVDSDKNNFLEIFKAGAEWQKDKMMEDAVDGEIYFNMDYLQYHINTEPLTHFHHGDKVKLIIVKEE